MNGRTTIPGVGGLSSTAAIRIPGRGGDSRRNWLSIAQLAGATKGLAAGVQTALDQVGALKGPLAAGDALHPFKIYRLPTIYRLESAQDPANDWRKFRVRAGAVFGASAVYDVSGCDSYPFDPDSDAYLSTDDEIVVPDSTSRFWFWIEIGSAGGTTTAVVRYGDDPTIDTSLTPYDDGVNPEWSSARVWSVAPRPTRNFVPIGWVDTLSGHANKDATVRQFLRSDVLFLGGGITRRGPYKTTEIYNTDDLTTINDGGPYMGSYLALRDNLNSSVPPQNIVDGDGVVCWEKLPSGMGPFNG